MRFFFKRSIDYLQTNHRKHSLITIINVMPSADLARVSAFHDSSKPTSFLLVFLQFFFFLTTFTHSASELVHKHDFIYPNNFDDPHTYSNGLLSTLKRVARTIADCNIGLPTIKPQHNLTPSNQRLLLRCFRLPDILQFFLSRTRFLN